MNYGKCACCDEDATIFCHVRNVWTCDEHFLPSPNATISEMDYYKKVQDVVILKAELASLRTKLHHDAGLENKKHLDGFIIEQDDPRLSDLWQPNDPVAHSDLLHISLCKALYKIKTISAELSAKDAQLCRAREGLKAVESLINDSRGVDGLHLNGDVATWEELRSGGRFEEWLRDFDAALSSSAPCAHAARVKVLEEQREHLLMAVKEMNAELRRRATEGE
jgi:hypothetical protein